VTAPKTAALMRFLNLDQASGHPAFRRSGPAHGLIRTSLTVPP